MSVTVDTSGFDRFIPRIPSTLEAGADAGADTTVDLAKQIVPVSNDPPHTRDTIQKVGAGQSREVEAREAAIVIELGTSKMAARPFLMPAATSEATFQAMVNAVKRELGL